jgi:hypothetical protein
LQSKVLDLKGSAALLTLNISQALRKPRTEIIVVIRS